MLSADRGILIKNFMDDRERLGTVSFNQCKGIFDNNIYDSLQSHKETQSVEESIQLIQENEDTTIASQNIVTDVLEDKDSKKDSKKESENIYEHELKSILLIFYFQPCKTLRNYYLPIHLLLKHNTYSIQKKENFMTWKKCGLKKFQKRKL